MLLLRPLILLCLIAASCGVGVVGSSYTYEKKLSRISDEREGYRLLTIKAMAMSDKVLVFAEKYQEGLSACMSRVYRTPVIEPGVAVVNYAAGGRGGPFTVRSADRLP
jgi:hypothetical protein